MRNVILIFTTILANICLAQNDFRKMNWGESPQILEEKYPDSDFEKSQEGIVKHYVEEGFISGYETLIQYTFIGDEFSYAGYVFSYNNWKPAKDKRKEFDVISDFLKNKYVMKRKDNWLDSDYKGNDEKLDFALSLGDVELVERYEGEDKTIVHFLGEVEGELRHMLSYYSPNHNQRLESMNKDDF